MCLGYTFDHVYITPHVVFDESVFPMANHNTFLSSLQFDIASLPPTMITLPTNSVTQPNPSSTLGSDPLSTSETSVPVKVIDQPAMSSDSLIQ